jgi:hypothetical protein
MARMIFFCCGFFIVLFGAFSVFSDGPAIDRSFGRFRLGSGVAALKDQRVIERPKAFYGQRADEQRFEVLPPDRPQEVETFNLDFFRGVLYRIDVLYSGGYAEKNPWNRFTEEARARYGTPKDVILPGSEVLFWDDGVTRLLLARDNETGEYSRTLIDDDILYQVGEEPDTISRHRPPGAPTRPSPSKF